MVKRQEDRSLDLSALPPGAVRSYRRQLCLACIFDIYTKQLGLGPRTAYSEVKRHAPSVEELTGHSLMRPFFESREKNPRCPYCNAAKRWHALLDTYRIEAGNMADAARKKLVKSLPAAGEQFQFLDHKSTKRAVFFEWLDSLGRSYDFDQDTWLLEAARSYLERKEPKTGWAEVFEGLALVLPSARLTEGWAHEGNRLYLAPSFYNEVLLVQYLVSRSHKAGGRTFQGRLTLVELLRRLRRGGYLSEHGITERDQFEVLEKVVDEVTGGDEAVKLHYIVDRRQFLERLKSVYSEYAS
jgi:hypothetical protein